MSAWTNAVTRQKRGGISIYFDSVFFFLHCFYNCVLGCKLTNFSAAFDVSSLSASQIGRSTESPIDFVVTDTVPGSQSNSDTQSVQSTISRFACRIICQRTPPYTARIYAAGFDSSKNIFLGVRWREHMTSSYIKTVCDLTWETSTAFEKHKQGQIQYVQIYNENRSGIQKDFLF